MQQPACDPKPFPNTYKKGVTAVAGRVVLVTGQEWATGWTVAGSRKETNRAAAMEAERRRTQIVTTQGIETLALIRSSQPN